MIVNNFLFILLNKAYESTIQLIVINYKYTKVEDKYVSIFMRFIIVTVLQQLVSSPMNLVMHYKTRRVIYRSSFDQ